MIKKTSSIACVALLSVVISGCAPRLGGSDYSVGGVGEVSTTLEGVVIAKRTVRLNGMDNSQPGVGAVAGGLGGALAGNAIGKGHGRSLATAGGALAGAFAGHFVEQGMKDQDGFEYQVKLTTNEVITIAQGLEPNLTVGQPVFVIKSDRSRSRIIAR